MRLQHPSTLLLQIEEQFHPEYASWNLYNPWENLIAAMGVYRKQGIGAWYASSGAGNSPDRTSAA